MRSKVLLFTLILILTMILTGCPDSETNSNVNQANNAPANNAKTNGNNPLETKPVTNKEETTNKAETVTPVVKAYCDAMTKKDEAALRKVFSQATLKFYEQQMKDEKIKTLVEFMSTEQVSNKLCEVRNEKVEGNTAVAEIRTEGAPNGFKVKFIKENGEWKMTNEIPDFKDVENAANSSTTSNTTEKK